MMKAIDWLDNVLGAFLDHYWQMGGLAWTLLYLSALFFTDDQPMKDHLFTVALIHWATCDILAKRHTVITIKGARE